MLLGNRYHLEETLGQGGAGIVYRALDIQLQRTVAVKYLNPSPGGPDRGDERLRREAASLSRLHHPHIVEFYDMGIHEGRAYLVLEYISGCTLHALLEAHPEPLPIDLAEYIIKAVLAALQAAHQSGIVHRDLKPENIMLVDVDPTETLDWAALQPEVKVMDFGLAYLHGDVRITDEDVVAGTALYIAPEAALGQAVDERADLYAVGLILYELVAGRPVFQGDDSLVLISQHLHATPVSPRWHNRQVSSALATLILKLLAKNPTDRYQTANEVLAALETIQTRVGPEQPPTVTSLLDSIARGRWVGRAEEISLLRGAVDTMLRGPGSVVFIEGPAGIGKSRLVREVGVYARLKGAQVFTGHCYNAEMELPYQPFIEIVKGFVQTNIKPGTTGYLPESLAAELVKLVPGLEIHLGVASAPAHEVAADARLRLFEAVTTLLTGSPHPVVVILENLHRGSVPDLALFHHLAQTGTPNRRLLLLVTHRSQGQPKVANNISNIIAQLNQTGRAKQISLQPLTADGVALLLQTLLEGEVAPIFSQTIFKVTEGHPFFIEEILKALIEEGRIFRDPSRGRWEGADLENLEVPASLKDVLARRFEKLNRTQRHALTMAALLGRQFKVEALLAVTGATKESVVQIAPENRLSEEDVLGALEAAIEMQLLRRMHIDKDEFEIYRFEHSLLHRALYDNLSRSRRRQLHRQIACALEHLNERFSQSIASPDELAYHFSQAGDEEREKAISYSLIAIENALQVYASEAVVNHYQLILDLLDTSAYNRRAWILEQLGDLYFRRTRQIVDAVAAYEHAINLWKALPNPDRQALIRLYTKMGAIAHHWHGHVTKLDEYLSEALHLLDQDPAYNESLERARVLTAMAFNQHAQSDTQLDDEEALKLAQTAVDLAVRLEAADEEATALDALQRIYRRWGDLTTAHEIDRRRLALIPRMTNRAEAVDANIGASHMGWETGDLGAAIKFCLGALSLAQQTDNIGGQWQSLRRLVMLHLQWGKLSNAVNYAQQGVALGPRAGILEFGQPVEALFRAHLAILYALQGQTDESTGELAELKALYPWLDAPPYRSALGWFYYETEAWDMARRNLETGAALPPPFLPHYFDRVFLVDIYGHQGDAEAINHIKDDAQAEVERWNMPYLLTIFYRGCGVFHTHQKEWAEAEAAFKRALATTRRQVFWYQDARTWLDYGRMLARRHQSGDVEQAHEFLSEAQGMFTSFGAYALAEKSWVELTRLSQ